MRGYRIEGSKEASAPFLNVLAITLEAASFKRVARALNAAGSAHRGQKRDDGTPYILHPLRVARSLVQELDLSDPDVLCAALLHDVAEDQKVLTLDDIKEEFGARVSGIVRTLTRPEKRGRTRQEINKIYFARLSRADEDCKLIKLTDKLDNVRDAINCPDPAKRQRTIAEARDFYLSLAFSLESDKHRRVLLNSFREAIHVAEGLENDTPPRMKK